MEIQEWIQDTKSALETAGFSVKEWNGFPLVEVPKELGEGVRLLKLPLPHGGYKTIYAEGMLVTPVRMSGHG